MAANKQLGQLVGVSGGDLSNAEAKKLTLELIKVLLEILGVLLGKIGGLVQLGHLNATQNKSRPKLTPLTVYKNHENATRFMAYSDIHHSNYAGT